MSSANINTRTKILTATISMLEEHGGRGVRMSDIAKECGLSRQAVYLHFTTRVELLIAATKHCDEILDLDLRLAPSRNAKSGVERLELYIECWGSYMPEIYGVAKALILAQDTDEAAAVAWLDRMHAMKEGCLAAIDALITDEKLAPEWTRESATDVLWTMLQVPNWENFTNECGWSNKQYISGMKTLAKKSFVKQ